MTIAEIAITLIAKIVSICADAWTADKQAQEAAKAKLLDVDSQLEAARMALKPALAADDAAALKELDDRDAAAKSAEQAPTIAASATVAPVVDPPKP